MAGQTFVLKNVEIFWCKLLKHQSHADYNQMIKKRGDGMEWSVQVKLNDKQLANLKKEDPGTYSRVKKSKGGDNDVINGKFLHFTNPLINASGKAASPVRILDSDGTVWDQESEIGNGSIVHLKYFAYDTDSGPGKRLSLMKVIKHVEYSGGSDDDFGDEEGTNEEKAPWDDADDL